MVSALVHVVAGFALVAGLTSTTQDTAAGADAKVIADFQVRVKEYAALHQKVDRTLPPHAKDTDSQAREAHRQALQRLLERARAGAKRGDIFTDSIRPYFRRQLARALEGPDGQSVRNSIKDEDTRGVRLAINGRYPESLPVSSVPPQVLLLLPRLPEELQYRFVDDQLVLMDVHANIVVDFIEKAIAR